MRRTGFTRRSLLAAGAGALGGPLLAASASSVAAPAGLHPGRSSAYAAGTVAELALGHLGPGTHAFAIAGGASLVGVGWQAPRAPEIELRFRAPGGWSAWAPAGERGHGPDAPAAGAPTVGEPIWTAGASELQLRTSVALRGVSVHAVELERDPPAASERARVAALALAEPVLAAGPGQPPIIARQAWARGKCPPRVAPGYGTVELAIVHHTDNPNGYSAAEVPAMLRAIYLFHRYVRGWNDIGYNFVIDLHGRIFEARAGGIDEPVVGAQAGGYNLYSSGAAVLGTFSDREISSAARRSLEALLSWKLSLHGSPTQGEVVVQVNPGGASYSRFPVGAQVTLPRIAGHREADQTDCPGSALYAQLPSIRAGAAAQAGMPAQATIALVNVPSAQAPPLLGEGAAAAGVYLFGTLTQLDGTPLAGAQVQIQARSVALRGEAVSESTLAQASTNEQGEWALPAAPAGAQPLRWLRALYAGAGAGGYGAAVSEAVRAALA